MNTSQRRNSVSNFFAESCLDTIKLAKPAIPIYRANGRRTLIGVEALRILKTAGRIARLIQRKRDLAVTRAYMTAEPDEIAKRITAQAEVVQELPETWTHRSSLAKGM